MNTYFCAADLGFRSDASAAVVVGLRSRELSLAGMELWLAGWLERRPSNGKPLQPSSVLADIAALARRFTCGEVWSDFHYAESAREELAKAGVDLQLAPSGATGKAVVWSAARQLILEGRVRVPRVPALLSQLKAVRAKPTSGGGLAIEQPRRNGSHGDLAAAFALGLWAATNDGLDILRWRAYSDLDAYGRTVGAFGGTFARR